MLESAYSCYLCCVLSRCDEGWNGTHCEEPMTDLPQYLYDMYTGSTETPYLIAGGKMAKPCKTMASGLVLHFNGVGNTFVISA